MPEQEKLRSEIDDKYKWDLTKIYEKYEDWEKDYFTAKQKIEEVSSYKDKFLKSSSNLMEYFKYDESVDRLLSKLYFYSHLNYDSDTTCDKYKEMVSKVLDLFERYSTLSAFVLPSILKVDYEVFEKFYKENKELLNYNFVLDEIYRYRKHTLDEKTEKILSSLSKTMSNPSQTYEILTDSDFVFNKIKDENGNMVDFNESNYSTFIKSKDRRVRKDAFEILFNKYKEFKNTIASTFSGNIDSSVSIAKVRGYDSAISASLYEDNVPLSVYDNLIDTVNKNMNVIYKYYDLKKKVLKLDEMHMYDIYANLIDELDVKYSFDDAKKIVVDALSVLGDEYIKNLNKAFDEKWIDIYHNKGKRSGAYSSGFYDTNPYVLLNYEGTLNDVSTLAHELGHSMHTYYSCKNNLYQYSSYKIFVAEVASTVNELILGKYLLKNSKSKEEKLSILNHLMELFKATIFRQTMFAEFEKNMYAKRENKEILTSTLLCNDYYELVKKYFGDGVIVDDLIRYEWQRIPHFYNDFYVYKYATGLSAACYIVEGILSDKEKAKENYFKFLKSGGSMYPIDELKLAGVDMNDKEVVQSAINMFSDFIDEFESIYYE